MTIECWVCGDKATTREHKFKASLIREWYGGGQWNDKANPVLGHISASESCRELQSSNDKRLKYAKSLCLKCNSERSQAADMAFDLFVKYITTNAVHLLKTTEIPLAEIGPNTKDFALNIHRYFAKLFGCTIAREKGWAPSPTLQQLVLSQPCLWNFNIQMCVSMDLLDIFGTECKTFGSVKPVKIVNGSGYIWMTSVSFFLFYLTVDTDLSFDFPVWSTQDQRICLAGQRMMDQKEQLDLTCAMERNLLLNPDWVLHVMSRIPLEGYPKDPVPKMLLDS